MSNQEALKALDQYLVLDLTRARAGPTATRRLADFDARVIKIEMPGAPVYGDMGTRHGPVFQNLHRNKESITLNLKATPTAAMWDKFCSAHDLGAVEHDPDYATPHVHRDNRTRLNEIIEEKTRLKTTDEWLNY